MDKDKMLESLWKKLNSLRSKEGYIYSGSPKFLGLFGRDSLITAWEMMEIEPAIAKHTLLALAKVQGKREVLRTSEEPGKIAHEYYSKRTTSKTWFKTYKAPFGWVEIGQPLFPSVDSTPLFLIVLAKYYEKTNDKATLRKLWPNAKKALSWITDNATYNKFIRYTTDASQMSQSWKDDPQIQFLYTLPPIATIEVQGYSYKAFRDMITLMHVMADTKREKEIETRANELRENVEKYFWMHEQRYYAMAINGSEIRLGEITSNPGQLLFTDIINEKRAKAVIKRLFMKDMFTPYGIRTLSSADPDFDQISYQCGPVWPHDNWITAQGLKHLGFKGEYNKVKNALIKAQEELKTIPEYYGVDNKNKLLPLNAMKYQPCDPQAWSLGALIEMMQDKY